jgi:hypothetical protein
VQDKDHVAFANAAARKGVVAKDRDQVRRTMILVMDHEVHPGRGSRRVGTELDLAAARNLHVLGMQRCLALLQWHWDTSIGNWQKDSHLL